MRWRLAKKIEFLTYKKGFQLTDVKSRHLSSKNRIKQYQYDKMIDISRKQFTHNSSSGLKHERND
jgi:hypothetical protein